MRLVIYVDCNSVFVVGHVNYLFKRDKMSICSILDEVRRELKLKAVTRVGQDLSAVKYDTHKVWTPVVGLVSTIASLATFKHMRLDGKRMSKLERRQSYANFDEWLRKSIGKMIRKSMKSRNKTYIR